MAHSHGHLLALPQQNHSNSAYERVTGYTSWHPTHIGLAFSRC